MLKEEAVYKFYKFEFSKIKGDAYGCQMQEIILDVAKDDTAVYKDYQRTLDLDNAIATVDYTIEDVGYHREYLVSNPDNIMAVKLTADKKESISKFISIATAQKKSEITAKGDMITLTGQPYDHREDGLHFAQQVKVIPTNGSMEVVGNGIKIDHADEILILMSAGTNYQQCMDESFDYFSNENPLEKVTERIEKAQKKGYERIKEDHVKDYRSLYDNVKLELGAKIPEKTTDMLLRGYNGRSLNPNSAKEDLYLETLFYQFGRYLLISSSREGSLPANLQGIWANGLNPPWQADYHTNINVQMNYWPAEQTNLAECHKPMIAYINSLVPRGTFTAKKIYGEDTRGWTTFHENNIWGNTAPAVSDAFYTPTAAAWLCQDIWETYAFSMDQEFLEENYDTMLQSALFLADILVEDTRDHTLVVSPSFSPEHGPYSMGSTFDQAVVWDVFNNVILASEVLKKDTKEVQEIKDAFEKLSGPKIGLAGQFQEWKDETVLDIVGDYGHRHVNHLYGLHPGKQIVAGRSEQEDAYVEAMKNTLNTRGDGGTGWSKAWKINFWARLRDGERAHKLLEEQLKDATLTNLFDTCPPFQIDGNFGATAGMTEMLLQSQGDVIELLPAMPSEWKSGSVTGLRARGNVQIDMSWEDECLTGAVLKAGTSSKLRVRGKNIGTSVLKDSKGKKIAFEKEDADTIAFDAAAGETYTIDDIRDEEAYFDIKFSLKSGIYLEPQELKLDCACDNADIHYTLDGSEPTLESPVYRGEIVLPYGICTVKAAAFAEGQQMKKASSREFMVHSVNIAQGKSAAAPDTAIIGDMGPEKTVDGDLNSRMATYGNATVEIDFGAETDMNALAIYQFVEKNQTSRISSYTVEYWDGTKWVLCVSQDNGVKTDTNVIFNNNPNDNPTQYASMGVIFDTVTTSRLRVKMEGSAVSIWEIEVYNNEKSDEGEPGEGEPGEGEPGEGGPGEGEPGEGEPGGENPDKEKPQQPGNKEQPVKTGDTIAFLGWAVLSLISGMVLTVVVRRRR